MASFLKIAQAIAGIFQAAVALYKYLQGYFRLKSKQKLNEAIKKVDEAKTTEERKNAAKELADSIHNNLN